MRLLLYIFVLLPGTVISQIDASEFLIARNTGSKIMSNGDTIGTMGFSQNLLYDPTVPGPTLHFFEGDSIEIDMWNVSQGAPHTIHLHGLDVDQQNDGVPHLSFDVPHMDHGYYYMKVPHPGTYLYHCHVVSSVHVQAGMYGMIIVHPADSSKTTWTGGYDYDISFPMLFSEIDTTWHNDSIMKHDHDTSLAVHYVEVPIYDPQFYMVNGMSDNQISDSSFALNTSVGAVNYLQLASLGYKGVRVILPPQFGAFQISSDGRPLPSIVSSDTVEIYPGERYGVLGTMPAEGTSQIAIEYFDLNTGALENTQYVPINVSGFVELSDLKTSEFEMRVLPNPSDGNFTINVYNIEGHKVRLNLIGLNGELIQTIQENVESYGSVYTKQFSNHKLSDGIYLIQLYVDDQPVRSEKIVIQK